MRKGLEGEGYWVNAAFDGQLDLSMALRGDYDLVILGVNLPQLNGFEVCRRLRAKRPQVAVLLLTALGGIGHKTEGYDAGADDYLVKPFEFQELLLRVRTLYHAPVVRCPRASAMEIPGPRSTQIRIRTLLFATLATC